MSISPEILAAYREHDRELTIRKFRVACFLGMVLVPLFSILDHFMYSEKELYFFILRVCCSVLIGIFYWCMRTHFGRRLYRWNGLLLFMLPTSCIAWMIHVAPEGAMITPYYAGLNLVLMVLAFVLDWTFWESLVAGSLILLVYLIACFTAELPSRMPPEQAHGIFVNNVAFLASTSVIIIVGSYFHSVLRLREFASQYELDKNRRALAAQNQVLEDTLKQLKETELQLVQTEKIVSLGRLSAGIIHEINNPLNFATTGLYVLKNQGQRLAAEEPGEFKEILRDVEDGLQRVKNIVSDLRSFTHPDAEQREGVKLADVITSSLRLLSNEWKERVQIDQAVPSDLMCRANKNKLTQVFVNLIQNSLDALKNKPVGPEPPIIRITGHRENGKVFLSVRDNGEGIEPQNVGKVFDPFFTTRDVGKGMGMGLSICYRIIQELHGNISVASERGKFCEFTIELPAAASESIAA
jgi:two-component system, sensor histidine kinase PhcS